MVMNRKKEINSLKDEINSLRYEIDILKCTTDQHPYKRIFPYYNETIDEAKENGYQLAGTCCNNNQQIWVKKDKVNG